MSVFKLPSILLLVFLVLAGDARVSARQMTVLVTGRAVDECGLPVPGVIATLYAPPCRSCIDNILPTGLSLNDGMFFIDAGGLGLNGLTLFLEGPIKKGFWSPLLDPPFRTLSHLREFQGTPITLRRGSRQLDLGDVPVEIRYSEVTVELTKVLRGQYQPDREAPSLLSLTLTDERGTVVYNGRLPEYAFDQTFSSINLALTSGRWTLTLHPDPQNRRSRPVRTTLDVARVPCEVIMP
jgi:hypothetical protein